MEEPDNTHVAPLLALYLAGLGMSVMGAIRVYQTIFNGMRVRNRSGGVEWSLFESLMLEAAILGAGMIAVWWGQRTRNQ